MSLYINKFQHNLFTLFVHTISDVQSLAEDLEMKSLIFIYTLQVIYKVYLHCFTDLVVRFFRHFYKY